MYLIVVWNVRKLQQQLHDLTQENEKDVGRARRGSECHTHPQLLDHSQRVKVHKVVAAMF